MNSWQKIVPAKKKIIMWGGGDQGRVNKPILDDLGCEIIAVIDDTKELISPFPGIPLLLGWEGLNKWLSILDFNISDIGFVIAIGNPYGHIRCKLDAELRILGLNPVSFSDHTALIRNDVSVADGLQMMPHSILHNNVRVNRQCIINTKALVEHDCILENGVEIGPGAVLCGRVHVGENTWIGAGAIIKQRVKIGRNSIIGAGSVVISDVPSGVVVCGVPSKLIPNRIPPSFQIES